MKTFLSCAILLIIIVIQTEGRYRRGSNYRSHGYDDEYNYADYDYDEDYYDGDYEYDYDEDYSSSTSASPYENKAKAGHRHHSKPRSQPVIIKKRQKKSNILEVQKGMYIPGGTAMYGKFKDVQSCQKACDLTPTCFAGDFNPWTNHCFMHTNLTTCMTLLVHPTIIHFKKVPCGTVVSPRSLVTLGAAITRGREIFGIHDLKTCIKKCSTLGRGIAPTQMDYLTHPQLCVALDFDFGNKKCFFHSDNALCSATNVVTTPLRTIPNPSTISILICSLANTG